MTTSPANRGKEAEALVKKRLEHLAKSANFVWYRPPDMRGGHRQEALADFMTLDSGVLTLIEVKQVQHDYRLPHSSVGVGQVARLRMWELAGASCYILVYHSTTRLWRAARAGYFSERLGGSWDMRAIKTKPLEEVLL